MKRLSVNAARNLRQFEGRTDEEVAASLWDKTARLAGRVYRCRQIEVRLLDGTLRKADALDVAPEGAWLRDGADVTFVPAGAILRVTLTDAHPTDES